MVNAVREDPARRSLLFAGTERGVHVSFDDGDHWQSLRLNLPATSVRDLVVHDSDLVVATHGRSFWILDDITPLRQIAAAARAGGVYLYRPAVAVRVRWNENTDTPLPPDEPAGKNPPDGAVLDYYLPRAAAGSVTLEIVDRAGKLVRRFSSADAPEPADTDANIPLYWIRSPQVLSTAPGMHRFVWDLHYPAPPVLRHEYPISAIYRDTPREPRGPWVIPGEYTIRLVVAWDTTKQQLAVRMDPRLHLPPGVPEQQLALALRLVDALRRDSAALAEVRSLRTRLGSLRDRAGQGPLAAVIDSLDARAAALESGPPASAPPAPAPAGAPPSPPGRTATPARENLSRLNGELVGLYGLVEGADAAPTTQAVAAVGELERALATQLESWRALRERVLQLQP